MFQKFKEFLARGKRKKNRKDSSSKRPKKEKTSKKRKQREGRSDQMITREGDLTASQNKTIKELSSIELDAGEKAKPPKNLDPRLSWQQLQRTEGGKRV
jgi:hypothetical protein